MGKALRAVIRRWRRRLDRMTDEPTYADAFIILISAALKVFASGLRVRAVARELATAYLAILRPLQPRSAGNPWDWPTDN